MWTSLNNVLTGLSGGWAYAAVALFAFLESAAFIGLVIPGETAMLLGGVLAATGHANLPAMAIAGSAGAVLGDLAGYGIGRAAGPALRRGRLGRWVGPQRWHSAEDLVERRGGPAVFIGRWIGLLRAVVPAAAGAVRMPPGRFMTWNAVGGVLWASTVIGLGYAAGSSWPAAQRQLGTATVAVALGGVLIVAVVFTARRWRTSRRAGPAASPEAAITVGAGAGPASRAGAATLRVGRPAMAGALLAAALGVIVGELSDNVVDGSGVTGVDGPVLRWMLGHRSPATTHLMMVVTNVGGTVAMAIAALLVTGLLAWLRRWPEAMLVATVAVGSAVLVNVIKPLIGRARPPQVDQLVLQTNQSFPSGHAVGAAAVLGVLTVLANRRLRHTLHKALIAVAAAVTVTAVGLSRLYLGVHWASDVIVGWLLGGLWLTICLTATTAWAAASGPARHAAQGQRP
ncbi:MAG TPA: bifunctional DedA family/phosphatase PAP2 family protein [Pseudonocardiaceae bacterium]|nr:bifunctional DedA family/phosphatase PAP2 family protein [Pseudonocardiaceae bacterium]